MQIFVTGGTGFVGRYITARLTREGHEVFVLSRSAERAKASMPWAAIVKGDPKSPGPWQERAAQCDAAINLAGTTIFTLWTDDARKSILDSRVLCTQNLVEALKSSEACKTLISASAVGYYGSRLDDTVLDESQPPGNEFMSEVCLRWEEEALKAEDEGIRVCICRFGIVLGHGGGALEKMKPIFRYFLGTGLGSGRQWFSWIHEEDLFRAFEYLLDNELEGTFNCVSPNPVRNADFATALAHALGRPVLLPRVPAFVLRTVLGEFGNVLLKGQRVVPKALLDRGFTFNFPGVRQALEDLV